MKTLPLNLFFISLIILVIGFIIPNIYVIGVAELICILAIIISVFRSINKLKNNTKTI